MKRRYNRENIFEDFGNMWINIVSFGIIIVIAALCIYIAIIIAICYGCYKLAVIGYRKITQKKDQEANKYKDRIIELEQQIIQLQKKTLPNNFNIAEQHTQKIKKPLNPLTEDEQNQLNELLQANHLLIAGASGSGKSVLLNNLIYQITYNNIGDLILIDPKRVELSLYKKMQNVFDYTVESHEAEDILTTCIELMMERYKTMEKQGLKQSRERAIYIIIDEYADLMLTHKKTIEPKILRIAQLGRAANIHLILATQRPTANVVNSAIKTNIDNRIALKVPTWKDSQNIISQSGAEQLPKYGKAYYFNGIESKKIDVPFIEQDHIRQLVAFNS